MMGINPSFKIQAFHDLQYYGLFLTKQLASPARLMLVFIEIVCTQMSKPAGTNIFIPVTARSRNT